MSDELPKLKERVSKALLARVAGVVGVGLPEQRLTVYLESDSPEVRAAVTRALAPLKLAAAVAFEEIGKITRR